VKEWTSYVEGDIVQFHIESSAILFKFLANLEEATTFFDAVSGIIRVQPLPNDLLISPNLLDLSTLKDSSAYERSEAPTV